MQNHAFIKKNCQNGQFATLVVENQVKSSFGKGIALVIAALALAFACFCFTPQQAYAKSYEMPHTTINATVQPNGDLHVVEQRTFDFSGTFTAVWWNFDSFAFWLRHQDQQRKHGLFGEVSLGVFQRTFPA